MRKKNEASGKKFQTHPVGGGGENMRVMSGKNGKEKNG
jgi:hypothetical protein